MDGSLSLGARPAPLALNGEYSPLWWWARPTQADRGELPLLAEVSHPRNGFKPNLARPLEIAMTYEMLARSRADAAEATRPLRS